MKLDEIFNPEGEFIDNLDQKIFLFVEGCFEIAFGDNSINRDFTPQQVKERLRTFSDQSHFLEEKDKLIAEMREVISDGAYLHGGDIACADWIRANKELFEGV
jgi:hypothetical protein